MPNPNNMLFVRPKHCDMCAPPDECDTCIQGYYALKHVANQAWGWNTIDLAANNANKSSIYATIDEHDPGSCYMFGHGGSCVYTATDRQPVFTCEECSNLAGRIIYMLSCLTANNLGPEIIRQGAIAYAGFKVSWTWLAEYDGRIFLKPDPYDDFYARGFYESANELWLAMLKGRTMEEAVQASIDKYDAWIDYWFYENPEDPLSQDCIMWLAHDRDGLVYYSTGDIDSTPPRKAGIGIGALIPIIAVVGIALILGQK